MKKYNNNKSDKLFLSVADRKTLLHIIQQNTEARMLRRALVLRMSDQGYSAVEIAKIGVACDRTVRNLRERYEFGGLDEALYDKERSGKPREMTIQNTQRIVAIACSAPPVGRARWTLNLLREQSLKIGILKKISCEKIRIILHDHDLKPWRQKMWCVPRLDEEYVARMEDVLAVYEKPYNPKEPVVCLDEKPVQLLAHKRDPQPMRPGKIARQDYEYKRNGSVNVFRAVEPKAGRHFTKVTPTRKKPEIARILKTIVNKYPDADRIHLVWDNLSGHKENSLTETFGLKEGRRIWSRIVPHYTPKHASWLNQAEIGIGIYARQCLGKDRIADIEELTERSAAWNRRANREKIKIGWKFTRKKARQKFGYQTGKN